MNINLGSLFFNNEGSDMMQQVQQAENGEVKETFSSERTADIRNLLPGMLFEGDVADVNHLQVKIILDNNSVLNASMKEAVNLNIGEHVVFQVKENSDSKIVIKPFQNDGGGAVISKALNASGITINDKNVAVVKELMAQGQPLDKNTIMDTVRMVNRFPDVNPADIIELKKHDIPVTSGNIAMYKAYSEGNADISANLRNISEDVPKVIENILSTRDMPDTIKAVSDILDIIMSGDSLVNEGDGGNATSANSPEHISENGDAGKMNTAQGMDKDAGILLHVSKDEAKANVLELQGKQYEDFNDGRIIKSVMEKEYAKVSAGAVNDINKELQTETFNGRYKGIQEGAETDKAGGVPENIPDNKVKAVPEEAQNSKANAMPNEIQDGKAKIMPAEVAQGGKAKVMPAEVAQDGKVKVVSAEMAQDGKAKVIPEEAAQDGKAKVVSAEMAQDNKVNIMPVEVAQDGRMKVMPAEVAQDGKVKEMTDEQEDKVASAIKNFEKLAEKVDSDKDADMQSVKREILKIYEEAEPQERKVMAQSEPFKKLVHNAIKKNMFIRPDVIKESDNPKEEVAKLYEKVKGQFERLSESLKEAVSKGLLNDKQSAPVLNNIKEAGQNLNFMNELNNMASYVQIPVKFTGQEAAGELYVFNRNIKKTVEEGISAFLHFDLDNLGVTDIRINLKNKGLRIGFELDDKVSVKLVEEHIEELLDRLEEKGYLVNCSVEHKAAEGHNSMEKIFEQDKKQVSIKRYTLDIRT